MADEKRNPEVLAQQLAEEIEERLAREFPGDEDFAEAIDVVRGHFECLGYGLRADAKKRGL